MKLDEMHKLLYELLEEVHTIVSQLNLGYYLAYGTLLGAVRHSDIIPWDDDIDLFMMRKDYEELINRYNQLANKTFLYSHKTHDEYHLPFVKISLKETHSKSKQVNVPITLGVSLDIFPIDFMSNSLSMRTIELFFMKLINRSLGTYHYPYSTLRSNKERILWMFSRICGYDRLAKASKIMVDSLNTRHTDWCGNLVWGSYAYRDTFPFSYLGIAQDIKFGHLNLPSPALSKQLLTRWYGDYMRIPSEQEIMMTSHNFVDQYERY